jgi:hypothetical protein
VTSVGAYAVVRFVAGVGLAGELGAGITLVSETMRKETRGYGTALVATVGVSGAVVAAIVGNRLPWRTAYFIGGGLGVALLGLRLGVLESGMFKQVRERAVSRGNFFLLFRSARRAWRYIAVILVGVPIWYVVGILVTFAPEIGGALGMKPAPNASRAVLFCYTGLIAGDIGSGALSQLLRSRKKVIATFILVTAALIALYFTTGRTSLATFYGICGALGVATGYWAVFVTIASEQFGTNIRATVTTTTPNFVRGAVVLLTSAFQGLKSVVGVVGSAKVVGAITIALALVALVGLEETFGKDLDFIEE